MMKRPGEGYDSERGDGSGGGSSVGKRQRHDGSGTAGRLGNKDQVAGDSQSSIDIATPAHVGSDNSEVVPTGSYDHVEDDQSQNNDLLESTSSSSSVTSSVAVIPALEDRPALICYGMVPHIKCQRLSNVEHVVELDIAEDEEPPTYLPLSPLVSRGRLVVGTASCPELAHMNSKATFVLTEALKSGIQLRLLVERTDLQSFLSADDRNERSEFLFLDVNVLGPDSAREGVGAMLSRHAVYLQDPRCPDEHIAYSNPHIMDLDVPQVDIWFQQLAMELTAGHNKAAENTDWSGVLDDLPQQHTLTAIHVDRAVVTTPTMLHQGEALDFMCKRELGLIDDDLRFWQLDRNEDGAPVYRHTVTADEQYQPQPEPQGGILADDMGLGKTLTSISLIACSLERAVHFVDQATNCDHRETGQLPRSRATLVVVPSTQLMDSWTKELEKHTSLGALRVSRYHGHDRVRHFSELLDKDIVLTTYGTIATEYRRPRREVLYHMRFFRIVLDEAHTIRSRRTKLFKAITTLDAAHHWCLTGTPISNRVDDLGALLDFCRVPLLGDSKCFQRYVSLVAKKSIQRGCIVLRETLKPICLRRTRALLKIAQPNMIEKEITFSGAEKELYQQIMKRSRKAMDDAVSGRISSPRNTMLRILLKLRIFCNQGTFSLGNLEAFDHVLDADEQLTLLEEREEAFCDVCYSVIAMVNQLEDLTSGVLGHCSHKLCRTCFEDLDRDDTPAAQFECPVCEETTELGRLQADGPQHSALRSSLQYSSKLNTMTEDLLLSQNGDTPEKSIVFSVWRKTLNIAADLCDRSGIRYVRIDGQTPQSERSNILQEFTNNPSISTLFMTMGTGALGLNITAASRIHILEPQWNPAVEDQAVGRAVRLGQAKNATVIRYIVKDSVEKQIQGYQKRKMRLAAGGFEHRNENLVPEETVHLNAAYLDQA